MTARRCLPGWDPVEFDLMYPGVNPATCERCKERPVEVSKRGEDGVWRRLCERCAAAPLPRPPAPPRPEPRPRVPAPAARPAPKRARAAQLGLFEAKGARR
jgi:hypothetical protein